MENTALITVKALPEIQENLRALRERWDQKAAEAASMVCTEETVQTIKKMRAEMRDEFTQADTQRKAAKAMYLAPWNAVEDTFKDCVSDAFKRADASFKNTIDEFEGEIKARCRKDLERYFAELCEVYDVDFLSFDQALARKEERIRYRRRQYMYTLRNYEKKGRQLEADGITMEYLDGLGGEMED